MTEDERMAMALRWREAAIERRDFAQDKISAATDDMPGPEYDAHQNTADGMQDRIHVIDALFPELTETEERP